MQRPTALWVISLLIFLNACSVTRINKAHPLIRPSSDGLASQVYFIRPGTERYLGAADNPFQVNLGGTHLMTIGKREYVKLNLLPGSYAINVTNDTTWGPEHRFKKMTQARQFQFKPSTTHYVIFELVDGEFRGVSVRPVLVDRSGALPLLRGAVPVDSRATAEPIVSAAGS